MARPLLLFVLVISVLLSVFHWSFASGAPLSKRDRILHHLSDGGILGPSTHSDLRKRLDRLTPSQKEQLQSEARASQAHYLEKQRGYGKAHKKSSDSNTSRLKKHKSTPKQSGPDWSGAPAFIEGFMGCRLLSGLGVGVVQNGEVVFAQGFGVQSSSGPAVDTDTIFGIGSCTKQFSSTLGQLLVQEGLFDFNEPVVSYMPDYSLKDSATTQMITGLDMFTHRSGIPKNDLATFLDTTPTRKDRVYSVKYLDAQTTIRNHFYYSNLMVASGGYLLGQVAGAPDWETLIEDKIFTPLGLSRTFANFTQSVSQENRATPMVYDPNSKTWSDEPFEMNEMIDIAAPAGAIASTVTDLTKWLTVHLGHNQSFLTNASLQFLHSPKMTLSEDDTMPSWLFQRVNGANYAMNFWVGRYNDQKYIWHQGDVWGFHAMLAMLPESDIGIVLVTNSDSADSLPNQMWYRDILTMYLFDIALQVPNPTFQSYQDACQFPCNILPSLCSSSEEVEVDDTLVANDVATLPLGKEQSPASDTLDQQPAPSTPPSTSLGVNLQDYIGAYNHPAYGDLWVTFVDSSQSQLLMSYGNFALAPTNATLLYQANGGTDRFMWNISDTQAQSLYNSQVYFVRSFTNGEVQELFLETSDSAGATYKLWFAKVTSSLSVNDKEGEESSESDQVIARESGLRHELHKIHLVKTVARTSVTIPSASSSAASPSRASTTTSLPTSFLVLLLSTVAISVLVSFGIFAMWNRAQMQQLKQIIQENSNASQTPSAAMQQQRT